MEKGWCPDNKLPVIFKYGICLTGMAHVDYTAESGIDRLSALLPDEAEKLRETPFAVVQVYSLKSLIKLIHTFRPLPTILLARGRPCFLAHLCKNIMCLRLLSDAQRYRKRAKEM